MTETAAVAPALPVQARTPFSISVLLVRCTATQVTQIRDLVGATIELVEESELEPVVERLEGGRPVAAICLGEGFAGEAAAEFLTLLFEQQPNSLAACIVLAAGAQPEIFEGLIAEDRIYFISREAPSPAELVSLIEGALQRFENLFKIGGDQAASSAKAIKAQGLAETLRQLGAQTDPADLSQLLASAARELIGADRSYCLIYDPEEEILWAKDPGVELLRRESAAVGLASFVLRSSTPIRLAQATKDPRYDREVDDPLGSGGEHILAIPLREPGAETLAVLVAVRQPTGSPFDAAEQRDCERLATQAIPYLAPLCLEKTLKIEETDQGSSRTQQLFRSQALEHHLVTQRQGDPLRISPRWLRWSYTFLVLAMLAALVFSLVGEVHEYASGQAVVRIGGRTDLTALGPGTVIATEIEVGQRVHEGQILVRLHEGKELAHLQSIEREFELQLIDRLRDPTSTRAEQSLLTIRARRELALAGLEERTLRAPADGILTDLRVQVGQYLTPGQVVLSVARDQQQPTLLILLPGEYSPLIQPAMPARLEIAGYRYAYQHLQISAIRKNVVGPQEAFRYLGPGGTDIFDIQGPVVMVEAILPTQIFSFQGREYEYHDGMLGTVEVLVRSEKILFTLIPALKFLSADRNA